MVKELNTAYHNGKSVYRGKDGCITVDGLTDEEAEQAVEYGRASGFSIRAGCAKTSQPTMPDIPRKGR